MDTALLDLLRQLAGTYRGAGQDADTGPFDATLTVRTVAAGGAVLLEIATTGAESYAEVGSLARSQLGDLEYVTVTSGAPMHRTFHLVHAGPEGDAVTWTFGWGDPADDSIYREQLLVTVHPDGTLGLAWAWGVPGGEFLARSAVRVTRE